MSRAAASVCGSPMARNDVRRVQPLESTVDRRVAGCRCPRTTCSPRPGRCRSGSPRRRRRAAPAGCRAASRPSPCRSGSVTVSRIPGPLAGRVPASSPGVQPGWAASSAACEESDAGLQPRGSPARSRASASSRASRWPTSSRIRTRSVSRSVDRPACWVCRTWVTTAKPSAGQQRRPGAWARVARGRPARRSRAHADRAGSSGAPARRASLDGRHARNRCRRMAATLEKIRTPSTTTTPVDSCEPTPSWSPR